MEDVCRVWSGLWHPWLRLNRVLRAMLHERWSTEAWPQVKAEFKKTATTDNVRTGISTLSSERCTRPGRTIEREGSAGARGADVGRCRERSSKRVIAQR